MSWLLGGGQKTDVVRSETPVINPSDKWTEGTRFNGPQVTVENGGDKLEAVMYDGPLDIASFARHGWSLWRHRFSSQRDNPELTSVNHSRVSSRVIIKFPVYDTISCP